MGDDQRMPEVKCEFCGKLFEKAMKRITQANKLGQKHACSRKCASAMTNNYRTSESVTPNAEYTRRDKEKFPEKNDARLLVNDAVRAGKITPLQECELCGAEGKIEAHHPDHSKPFLLLYLCKSCHYKADSSLDKWETLATDYSERVT